MLAQVHIDVEDETASARQFEGSKVLKDGSREVGRDKNPSGYARLGPFKAGDVGDVVNLGSLVVEWPSRNRHSFSINQSKSFTGLKWQVDLKRCAKRKQKQSPSRLMNQATNSM